MGVRLLRSDSPYTEMFLSGLWGFEGSEQDLCLPTISAGGLHPDITNTHKCVQYVCLWLYWMYICKQAISEFTTKRFSTHYAWMLLTPSQGTKR